MRFFTPPPGVECPVGGWFSGLNDPAIRRALSAIHENPGAPWSVNDLARLSGKSRSAFAAHFTAIMKETPGSYLTRWRLFQARSLLRQTALSLEDIALRVGYGSARMRNAAGGRRRDPPSAFHEQEPYLALAICAKLGFAMVAHWRRSSGGALTAGFLAFACAGIANDPPEVQDTGGGPGGTGASGEGGASALDIDLLPLGGVGSSVPPGHATGGAACESPDPVACADLDYSQLTAVSAAGGASSTGGASGASGAPGVDIGLGAGDLTLLVIFDKSGSMGSGWDLRSRWQAASDSMIAGMAPYLDNLTIGAILFPQPDACAVAPLEDMSQINFVPGRQFVAEWVESACLNQPNGSTPMGLAFTMADQALVSASELGLLEDRFRVVLVTDGEPNCDTQIEQLPEYAAAWYQDLGVETWVIGLPGSDGAAALLDSIALAGGTSKHTPAGNPCEFQQAVGAAAK